MTKRVQKSRATKFLDQYPEIRQEVRKSKAFQQYRGTVPSMVIDRVRYYFPEGDIQKDEDDLILDYAVRVGLVSLT
jgi:hypothetical protein